MSQIVSNYADTKILHTEQVKSCCFVLKPSLFSGKQIMAEFLESFSHFLADMLFCKQAKIYFSLSQC